MYSQQEYETVRRQTMQIEAEKRALLRFMVVVLAILLIGALLVAGMFYGMYHRNISIADGSAARIEALQKQLDETTRALAEKTAQLEKITNAAKQQEQQLETMISKVLNKSASTTEIGEFAHAVYESPGRRVEVPRLPPNELFTRFYRYRTPDGKSQKFVLVAGELDGKWVIYSNLLSNNAPL
jgi:cell division protein FtsL